MTLLTKDLSKKSFEQHSALWTVKKESMFYMTIIMWQSKQVKRKWYLLWHSILELIHSDAKILKTWNVLKNQIFTSDCDKDPNLDFWLGKVIFQNTRKANLDCSHCSQGKEHNLGFPTNRQLKGFFFVYQPSILHGLSPSWRDMSPTCLEPSITFKDQ